jgi:hypothetical protein
MQNREYQHDDKDERHRGQQEIAGFDTLKRTFAVILTRWFYGDGSAMQRRLGSSL